MRTVIIFLFLCLTFSGKAQKDDFRSPLGIPLYLSGTFAELRSNHFHGGLDIKTNGKEGYRVYATKEGFISRIKVSAGGYGKAIYIQHPNGYTTVYGHLSEFNDDIARYVKQQQYNRQSFHQDLYLSKHQFPVEKGEVIGLSGNSGSSGGPHLHYEIRKTNGQIPINPMVYIPIKDDINPTIKGIRVHEMKESFYDSPGTTHKVTYNSPGNYSITEPIIVKHPVTGVSINAIDKQNGSNNNNGFASLNLFVDDQLTFSYNKTEIPFDVSRQLNAHIDYPNKKNGGGTYANCFRLPGNYLGIYDNQFNDGRIWLNKYPKRNVRIEVIDYAGNTSTVQFVIEYVGTPMKLKEAVNTTTYMPYNTSNYYSDKGVRLSIPNGALYDDLYFTYSSYIDEEFTKHPVYSVFHQLHDERVPLQKFMTVEVEAVNFPEKLRSKALLANLDRKGKIDVNSGKWNGNYFQVRTRNFGKHFITVDTTKPAIRHYKAPTNNDYSSRSSIQFTISDDLAGIKSYRGEVDGQWILMEYDAKRNRLYHTFDERITKGKHLFRLVVSDYVDNKAIEEFTFIR